MYQYDSIVSLISKDNKLQLIINLNLFILSYLFQPTPGYYFSKHVRSWMNIKLMQNSDHDIWLYLGIPFVLTTIICFLNCCLQIYWLLIRHVKTGRVSKINQKITRTIVLLTITCIICNTIAVSIFWAEILTGKNTFHKMYTVINMLPTINAFMYPLILILSGTRLNQYTRDILLKIIRVAICNRNFVLPVLSTNSIGLSSNRGS